MLGIASVTLSIILIMSNCQPFATFPARYFLNRNVPAPQYSPWYNTNFLQAPADQSTMQDIAFRLPPSPITTVQDWLPGPSVDKIKEIIMTFLPFLRPDYDERPALTSTLHRVGNRPYYTPLATYFTTSDVGPSTTIQQIWNYQIPRNSIANIRGNDYEYY